MKNKVINLFDNNNTSESISHSYSDLFVAFTTPFLKDFENGESLEDVYELAINAWNLGNMKLILPNNDDKMIADFIDDDEEINAELLNKMINFKITNFKEYTHFIKDFAIEETNGKTTLEIVTETEDDYLKAMLDDMNDIDNQEQYEDGFINRNAIIIKLKSPFVDWHNKLYPDSTIDESDLEDVIIYLVDENIEDLNKWLRKKFDKFFTQQLEDWHTNKKEWPQKRNYKMFKQWFQVDISTYIFDLEKKPVSKAD